MNDGLDKAAGKIAVFLMVVSSAFCLYTSGFGLFSALSQRSIHWMLLGVPLFLTCSWKGKRKKIDIIDYVCAILLALSCLYLLFTWKSDILLLKPLTFWGLFFATTAMVMVLEAARRTMGNAIPIIAVLFIIYTLFGKYFPGALRIKGYSFPSLVSYLYRTTEGLFGMPISVSAQYILIFVLFGSFLSNSGAGQLFVDLAMSLTGRLRSGSAQATILSNALMGMISGSPVANVATVGAFTLPLLKRTKYPDVKAAALLAAAAVGSMFTPPVMGAGAFLIADYLGVAYGKVIVVAIIPAALYYISLCINADIGAAKIGLKGVPKDSLPDWKTALLRRGQMLLPIIVLVVMIIRGFSAGKSAFISIVIITVLSWIRKETRMGPKKLFNALVNGTKDSIGIGAVCACCGVIVGVISLTGIGVKFSSFLLSIAQGNPLLALVLTMIAAIILGMGMNPTGVYLILTALTVPALSSIGINSMAAHFFVFFFSCMGALTPPVCMAAYAAAGMAKTDPFRTGWVAFRMGLVAYIVPFFFCFNPALIAQDSSALQIVHAIVTAAIGVIFLTYGVEGFIRRKIKIVPRAIILAGSFLLMIPESFTDIIGLALLVTGLVIYRITTRNTPAPAFIEEENTVVEVEKPELEAKAAELLKDAD
jgi:TRAP transporter 4TM/12TM fusion protein